MSRVLLIDDDPVVRMLASAVLWQGGFQVETASNGAEGVQRFLSDGAYDIVITDIHMPELDGPGVIAKLRDEPSGANVPIVVLTGSESGAGKDALLAAGATACITKPIDGRTFVAQVRSLL